MRWIHAVAAGGLALGALGACGAGDAGASFGGDDSGGDGSGPTAGCRSSNECSVGYVCNEFGACVSPPSGGDGGVTDPPPEVEYDYSAPIASQKYIYVAMTAQNELARIDATTLEVKSTPVGQEPKVVSAIPGGDGAVVLDTTNGTATVVRPNGANDVTKVLATLTNLNRLDVTSNGRFAVVWFDLAKHVQEAGLSGVGSFQDVTVISLEAGAERAVNLTVGFHPTEVQFDAQGLRAYVITEDGVSVVDLGEATANGPSIVPPVPVAPYGAQNVEVNVLPTGQYAAVRVGGEAALRIVDVGGANPGQSWSIPLASPATDIDLAPDGSRVYAVSREAKQLAVVPVPAALTAPNSVSHVDLTNAATGSLVLAADGTKGVMFTNATADERLSLIDFTQPSFPITTWPLKKAVRAGAISPDGTKALIINAKLPGDPGAATSTEEYIDRSYGYTLVDLATGFAKLQITPVDPSSFAFSPSGAKAYVALDGGDAATDVRALQIITAQTGVVVTKALGSPPSGVGILPDAGSAFVVQRHPQGRITFVDVLTDAVRTVPGFDLNGSIVH
ncbi:hypothetical protein BH11MYX2_BH11MYX2_23550 [soil metagenome]